MTESRAVAIVGAVGVLAIGLVLLIGVGPLAGLAFVYVAVICLILDRGSLFARVDEAWEDVEKALDAIGEVSDRRYALELEVDALRDAHVELVAWCQNLRDVLAVDTDDMAWEAGPPTNPIGLPVQDDGPPTEESIEVAARQVRQLMEDGEMAERTFDVGGEQRTFLVRVERGVA